LKKEVDDKNSKLRTVEDKEKMIESLKKGVRDL